MFKIYIFLSSSVTWCIPKMFYLSSETPSGNTLILKLFFFWDFEKNPGSRPTKFYYLKSEQRWTFVLFIIVKMLIKIIILSL